MPGTRGSKRNHTNGVQITPKKKKTTPTLPTTVVAKQRFKWTKGKYDVLIRLFVSYKIDWTKDNPSLKQDQRKKLAEAVGWDGDDKQRLNQIFAKMVSLKAIAHKARNYVIKQQKKQSVEKKNDEDKFDEIQVDWLNYSGWPRSMATATRELFYSYIIKTPTFNHGRIESGSSSSYIAKPFGETAFSDLVDESALEAKLKGRIRQPTRSKKSRAEAKAAAFDKHTEQLQRLINL